MTRTDSRAARRVALLTFGVALAVIASTAGAGIIPGSILTPHGGGDGDSLPETDDYDDPLVDYDAVDYTLALNSTAEDDLDYSLTILGAVEPVDETANGTVDCTDQLCRVEGTLEPDETATYHVSGSIVGVQPDDGLVGRVNGTFEGDALVGIGTGAVSPTVSADEPEEPDDGDERSDDAGRDVPDDTTDPEDPGDNGGEVPAPPEPPSYSFNVTGMNVLGDDPDEEYITLNNTEESAVDMTDWTLRDREDGGRVGTNLDPFVFPDGFTLDAGEEVTIWSGEGENDDANLYWNTDVNIWNQTGDTIILRTADGETVLEHDYPDQTEGNGSNGTDPVVSNVSYEGCSSVAIDGEGDYAVEINTEFYGADGLTSQNYEDEVTLPATINVSGVDDGAVTDVAIEQTTILDGDGGVVAEQPNPEFEGCRDAIDAQYEDWQDEQGGDDNGSDGDTNESDGDNESDGGAVTAEDISIAYEGCSTVAIDVEGDASADEWEIWELSTRFFTESGIDTMILEPDDGIPTTIDANERVDGAVTDVEIEHVMMTGDGGETFVEASQPDESCGEQINQQWEEYQDETGDGSDEEATDGEEDDEDNENADADESGDETDGENDEASGDSEETGDDSDDADAEDATEEEDADEDDESGNGADENGEPDEDTGGEETSNGAEADADENDGESDGEEADSAASSDEGDEDESIESETEATSGNASG